MGFKNKKPTFAAIELTGENVETIYRRCLTAPDTDELDEKSSKRMRRKSAICWGSCAWSIRAVMTLTTVGTWSNITAGAFGARMANIPSKRRCCSSLVRKYIFNGKRRMDSHISG